MDRHKVLEGLRERSWHDFLHSNFNEVATLVTDGDPEVVAALLVRYDTRQGYSQGDRYRLILALLHSEERLLFDAAVRAGLSDPAPSIKKMVANIVEEVKFRGADNRLFEFVGEDEQGDRKTPKDAAVAERLRSYRGFKGPSPGQIAEVWYYCAAALVGTQEPRIVNAMASWLIGLDPEGKDLKADLAFKMYREYLREWRYWGYSNREYWEDNYMPPANLLPPSLAGDGSTLKIDVLRKREEDLSFLGTNSAPWGSGMGGPSRLQLIKNIVIEGRQTLTARHLKALIEGDFLDWTQEERNTLQGELDRRSESATSEPSESTLVSAKSKGSGGQEDPHQAADVAAALAKPPCGPREYSLASEDIKARTKLIREAEKFIDNPAVERALFFNLFFFSGMAVNSRIDLKSTTEACRTALLRSNNPAVHECVIFEGAGQPARQRVNRLAADLPDAAKMDRDQVLNFLQQPLPDDPKGKQHRIQVIGRAGAFVADTNIVAALLINHFAARSAGQIRAACLASLTASADPF